MARSSSSTWELAPMSTSWRLACLLPSSTRWAPPLDLFASMLNCFRGMALAWSAGLLMKDSLCILCMFILLMSSSMPSLLSFLHCETRVLCLDIELNIELSSLQLSSQVFLSHLHSDHHADLASLYVGAMFGRREPWEVSHCSVNCLSIHALKSNHNDVR